MSNIYTSLLVILLVILGLISFAANNGDWTAVIISAAGMFAVSTIGIVYALSEILAAMKGSKE